MKKIIAFILALVCALSFAACKDSQEPTQPVETKPLPVEGYEVGNLCPGKDLPIVNAEGETAEIVNPAKTGKVTVINFWGVWCGPCVNELPHLEEIAENYADTVTVVAIHSTQDHKKMPQFLAKNYPDSPIVFAWETDDAYNGEYYLKLGGEGYYPYTVVLNAEGIVTATKVGGMTYQEMQELVEGAMNN